MRTLILTACTLLTTAGQLLAQSSVLIEVSAGERDRAGVPITVRLPDAFKRAKSVYMQRLDTAQEVVTQRSPDDLQTLNWILQDRLLRGQSRQYRAIVSNIAQLPQENVSVRETERNLTLSVGNRSVLMYHTAVVSPPAGIDRVFARSGFIHPLVTPAGRVVTADFPEDHPHQHGIFFAWKQAEFEGRPIDFWNQADNTGAVEHVAVRHVQNGPVFAEIAVTLKHLDLSAAEGPKPVLNEEWTVRLYAVKDANLFDLTSRQTLASESPLKLFEYHYGGMGYRGPTEWLGEHDAVFQMRTSDGVGRVEGNHTRPHWVDAVGLSGGKTTGMRAVQHPENFRYPQPVRLHPSKPYFVFAPEVLGDFSIEPEQTYESQYRFIAYDGPPSATVEQLSEAWSDPPAVPIVE